MKITKPQRDVQVHFLLSREEARMLDALVHKAGLSRSDVLRQAIRNTHLFHAGSAMRMGP